MTTFIPSEVASQEKLVSWFASTEKINLSLNTSISILPSAIRPHSCFLNLKKKQKAKKRSSSYIYSELLT